MEMTDNTINNDMTMGGAATTLLAGRYRVVRQLGQGGMGSVWLAEDTKLDGFKVAIKMLPSVLVNNKRAYAQVKAEALVSLKLSHPNIVTVRAFEEESGSPFLVMDYIDGQTLDDYLAEKGKLTEEETVKLLKPVAEALDYAHTQGVVHRDVKPGNVMIRKDGTPFVLDFGIAREIQETMTRVTGKLSSGTLLYMSPEQLNGDAPKPAQDIYSFAAMAYECLKGEPPFSRGQIEYQIVNNKPEPLGPQFANCGPGVMAGLEKKPENRPVSCAAVLTSSRGNDGGRSSRPTPESRQEEPRSPARAAGGKGLVVGLIVALVLAAAGAYHYFSVKNAERRRLGEAQVTFERALTSLNEYERKIEKLSREDGFGSRIDEINEKIPSRIALKDVPSFLSAAERCADLEKECRQLLKADELRVKAKSLRDKAQQAMQKVQKLYASQDVRSEVARNRYFDADLQQVMSEAESTYRDGLKQFSQFDFENACRSLGQAQKAFEALFGAAIAAQIEIQGRVQKEQQAKEGELRKKNEKEIADLREACMSAKKAAEDAEASEFASKEMSEALKLLADADNALVGEQKEAYQTASNALERARQMAKETSKPKVTLKAMLNGEEVNATVISGLKDKTRKTPVTVDLSGLDIGSTLEFELSYVRDGVPYKGRGDYTVKKGKRILAVEMLVDEHERSRLAAEAEKERLRRGIVGVWKAKVEVTDGGKRYPYMWVLEFHSEGDVVFRKADLFHFGADGTPSEMVDRSGRWHWKGDVLEIKGAKGHRCVNIKGDDGLDGFMVEECNVAAMNWNVRWIDVDSFKINANSLEVEDVHVWSAGIPDAEVCFNRHRGGLDKKDLYAEFLLKPRERGWKIFK